MKLLVSGYGGESGSTAGIYDCEASRYIWESGIPAISFMCLSGDTSPADRLIGVGEHDDRGAVYLFKACDQGYTLADTLEIDGGSLCHIAYSKKNKIAVGSFYGNGVIFSVQVNDDGFCNLTSLRQGDSTGIPAGTLTRAHCAVFSADEHFVYSANIALDRIYCYEVINGVIVEKGFVQLKTGVGPRHILLLNNMMYVITEYSNEIIRLVIDNPEKPLVLDSTSTLPDGFDTAAKKSYCSTLCANADGSFIYGANRGANTIAVFRRNADGLLVKTGDSPCLGDWPRHIALCGSGTLAIANERSHYVSLCAVDNVTGMLSPETQRIPFDGASFMCEL